MRNNEMLLRRRNMLLVNVTENILDTETEFGAEEQNKRNIAIATIVKNVTSFGFLLGQDIIDILKNAEYKDIVSWYLENKDYMLKASGIRDNMEPLYKNFPEDVMNTDDYEMYWASLVYYLSHNTISPAEAKVRPELNEFCNLITINLGTEETLDEVFTNLLSSKVSFGDADRKDIQFFVDNDENFYKKFPTSIPNKENLVALTNMVIDHFGYTDVRTENLTNVYKTATDILRLAVALSGGNVSLAEKAKFKHFNKSERRFLLSLLNNCKNPVEDMLRYKSSWIALGEILHPGDYASRYENAFNAFSKIRSGAKIRTWGGRVDEAFEKKNLESLLKLLSSRPGEFCRRLDRVLSNFEEKDHEKILNTFANVSNGVETTVLIGLMQHMYDRKNVLDSRIFFPKGRIAKAFYRENEQKPICDMSIDRTIDICKKSIVANLSTKETMGKVFIDDSMKNFVFPMVVRNANRTLRPMARGSKMQLKDNATVARVFLYWHEMPDSYDVDLDLSVILLDSNYKAIGSCYYGNLSDRKVKESGCYHSGDVREAPNGASEFIDLDFDKLKKFGAMHVLVCVHSFTCQPFSELKEAFVGVMEREKPMDGKIYEPMTVVNRSDLVTEQRTSLAMMVDSEDKTVTWLDLGCDFNHADDVLHNINSSKGIVIPMAKAFTQRNLMNVYDMIALNVEARGELVTDKADADYIFSLEGYVEPEVEETEEVTEVETVEVEEVTSEEENEITETEEMEVTEEIVVEPPKHILVTPYDVDVLIGNYL